MYIILLFQLLFTQAEDPPGALYLFSTYLLWLLALLVCVSYQYLFCIAYNQLFMSAILLTKMSKFFREISYESFRCIVLAARKRIVM